MNSTKNISNYIINETLDLDRIIDDFTPYVKTIINNMVNNNLTHEDKEEILSDTFFILWKNRFKDIISLDSYIAGITKNLVKEKLRKRVITCDISTYENLLSYLDIDMFNDKRSKIENVKKNMNKLNETELKVLNMFYYSSKSTKDIAKTLNLSEINVRSKLYRIRKKIKKNLI